ncbi:MAG: ABC transporter permease [Giesbergeria sp.]
MGSNLYILISGSTSAGGLRSGGGGGPTLTVADAEAIAELDGVGNVAPVQQGTQQLVYGANNWSATVVGTTPPYLDARAWTIVSGYPFGDSDVRAATRVALIGQTAADNLFGNDDPLGKTIRIRQSPFVIVGVLGKKGQNLDGRDQDDTVIIPLTTAQRKVFGNPFPGSVRLIMVQATSAEAMPAVEKSMTALLRQRHRMREGQDNDFFLRNLAAAADSAAETTRVMSVLLGAIASVSLLVGGIGIMNIMLVSVTERTREIGIRMAIGARQRDILAQFLLEALMISVAGCLIGLFLGIGGALLTNALTDMVIVISGSLGPGGLRGRRRHRHLLRLLPGAPRRRPRSDRGAAPSVRIDPGGVWRRRRRRHLLRLLSGAPRRRPRSDRGAAPSVARHKTSRLRRRCG